MPDFYTLETASSLYLTTDVQEIIAEYDPQWAILWTILDHNGFPSRTDILPALADALAIGVRLGKEHQ